MTQDRERRLGKRPPHLFARQAADSFLATRTDLFFALSGRHGRTSLFRCIQAFTRGHLIQEPLGPLRGGPRRLCGTPPVSSPPMAYSNEQGRPEPPVAGDETATLLGSL